MRGKKIVSFIYTYSIAFCFIITGSLLFVVELLTMAGRDVNNFADRVFFLNFILILSMSLISLIDFIINDRIKEISYWCLLISVNSFFASILLSYFGLRGFSRITIVTSLIACIISFGFNSKVKNRKDYNFLAISYLVFISLCFLNYKPWLLLTN